MKTILITLLAAAAVGAQAQEVFTSRYNEQCWHGQTDVHDLRYNNRRMVMLEFCPGWEKPEAKNTCVDMNNDSTHLRCYRSEYLKEEYLVNQPVRTCFFKIIRGDVEIMCSEAETYRKRTMNMPTFTGMARGYGATSFQRNGGQ